MCRGKQRNSERARERESAGGVAEDWKIKHTRIILFLSVYYVNDPSSSVFSFICIHFPCFEFFRPFQTTSLKITFRPKFASSEYVTSHLLIQWIFPLLRQLFFPFVPLHPSCTVHFAYPSYMQHRDAFVYTITLFATYNSYQHKIHIVAMCIREKVTLYMDSWNKSVRISLALNFFRFECCVIVKIAQRSNCHFYFDRQTKLMEKKRKTSIPVIVHTYTHKHTQNTWCSHCCDGNVWGLGIWTLLRLHVIKYSSCSIIISFCHFWEIERSFTWEIEYVRLYRIND